MRTLPTDEHQSRKEKILQAVIHVYVKTGKPVGSSAISESFGLNLSPASVRNVLAELEREGFLTHPHTSAGRIPTDLGYKFYVDTLVKVQRLAEDERARIHGEYATRMRELEDLMQSTTRILSTLSRCAGFAVRPRLVDERIRRIDLIPVTGNQVLSVMVSESGQVRNQMLSMSAVPDEKVLRAMSQFLSEQLKGVTFSDAQTRLGDEVSLFRDRQAAQQQFMAALAQKLFAGEERSTVFVEGASNIFNFPEFRDFEQVRNFAALVDKKEALAEIFNRELTNEGLQVRIGVETPPELKEFSVISTSYQFRGRPLGVLGILGPKRMEYNRMLAIVNTVADLVNRFLDKNDSEFLEENTRHDG